MNRSLSWIDPAVLRTLLEATSDDGVVGAEASSAPHRRTPAPPPAPPAPAPTSTPTPTPEEQLETSPDPEPRPVKAASLPAFASDAAEVLGRVRDMVGWTMDLPGVEQSFVCNADGLVMAQREADPEFVASSSWLITSWERVERYLKPSGLGIAKVELEGGRWLAIVPAEASWGPAYLGLVSTSVWDGEAMEHIRKVFTQTVKEETDET